MAIVLSGRTPIPVRYRDLSPLFATLTKTPGVWGYPSRFGTALAVSAKGTRCMIQVLSFHILAHFCAFLHFFALTKNSTCFFSIVSALLAKKLEVTSFKSKIFLFPSTAAPSRAQESGVQLAARSTFQLTPQQILKIAQLIPEQIQLPRQALNFGLRAPVHGVVQFTTHAILHVLAVLAHHDDWRLNRCEQGQNEIQQNKRIRIPRRPVQAYVDGRVDAAQDEKTNDERPRPAELHHGIRDAFGQRRFCFDHFVRVAHRAKAHEMLRGVELPPQHRQHIHSRMRLALQQRRDISAADFHALCILNGRRAGLMRRLLQHRREAKKLAVRRLIHHHFLLIFVDRGDSHFSRDHHVSLPARITHLVNALPRSEILQLHLRRQHRRLVFVEQSKQRDVFQHFGIASHRTPLLLELASCLVFQALESSATSNHRAPSKPDESRGFKKHSAKERNERYAATQQAGAETSLDNFDFDVLSRSMLRQQRSHSLCPALQSFRAAKRNDDRQHLFRRARHHRPFRIARRAAVWPNSIGEQRQPFQVQIVLADALVGFARASRAKYNFTDDVPEIIESNRQPAFHRNEIDNVHDGVDFGKALTSDDSPKEGFRGTAIPCGVFSQGLVGFADRFNLWRFQDPARKGQFLDFEFSLIHLREQCHWRRARLHARGHARQRRPRTFFLQARIDLHRHLWCCSTCLDVLRHGAFYSQKARNGERGNRKSCVRLYYVFSFCESAPGRFSGPFPAGASRGTEFTTSACYISREDFLAPISRRQQVMHAESGMWRSALSRQ